MFRSAFRICLSTALAMGLLALLPVSALAQSDGFVDVTIGELQLRLPKVHIGNVTSVRNGLFYLLPRAGKSPAAPQNSEPIPAPSVHFNFDDAVLSPCTGPSWMVDACREATNVAGTRVTQVVIGSASVTIPIARVVLAEQTEVTATRTATRTIYTFSMDGRERIVRCDPSGAPSGEAVCYYIFRPGQTYVSGGYFYMDIDEASSIPAVVRWMHDFVSKLAKP